MKKLFLPSIILFLFTANIVSAQNKIKAADSKNIKVQKIKSNKHSIDDKRIIINEERNKSNAVKESTTNQPSNNDKRIIIDEERNRPKAVKKTTIRKVEKDKLYKKTP